jgi:hypothetical protein
LRRGTAVPAEVVARAGLPGRERVLAAIPSREGTWLLGTRDALVLVPAEGDEVVRIPWERVERAEWDRDKDRLDVLEVGEFGLPRPVHTYGIEDPGLLLPLVRERVSASVVLQRRVVVSGTRGFFVIARRPPSGMGELTWAYEFDRDVDPDDPAVREAAEQALHVAGEELGL